VASDELPSRGSVRRLAEQEDEATRLAGLEREADVQCGAGIEARAEAPGERLATERRRPGERLVAPEERRPIRRRRA